MKDILIALVLVTMIFIITCGMVASVFITGYWEVQKILAQGRTQQAEQANNIYTVVTPSPGTYLRYDNQWVTP